jgi:hypothetical protein
MSRLAAIAAAAAVLAAPWASVAHAAGTGAPAQPTGLLTWPGKTGAPAGGATVKPASPPAAPGAVDLSRQFFAGGDDMAAAPPPLDPRPVPGTQAATSTANTATNRARQNEILTADSASDGPIGGAEDPN